jgi:hypothetical protein
MRKVRVKGRDLGIDKLNKILILSNTKICFFNL